MISSGRGWWSRGTDRPAAGSPGPGAGRRTSPAHSSARWRPAPRPGQARTRRWRWLPKPRPRSFGGLGDELDDVVDDGRGAGLDLLVGEHGDRVGGRGVLCSRARRATRPSSRGGGEGSVTIAATGTPAASRTTLSAAAAALQDPQSPTPVTITSLSAARSLMTSWDSGAAKFSLVRRVTITAPCSSPRRRPTSSRNGRAFCLVLMSGPRGRPGWPARAGGRRPCSSGGWRRWGRGRRSACR